jgi:hypothetical protein
VLSLTRGGIPYRRLPINRAGLKSISTKIPILPNKTVRLNYNASSGFLQAADSCRVRMPELVFFMGLWALTWARKKSIPLSRKTLIKREGNRPWNYRNS